MPDPVTPDSEHTNGEAEPAPKPAFQEKGNFSIGLREDDDEHQLVGQDASRSLSSLWKMPSADWSACLLGSGIGCLMSALVLPATMAVGLCPGLSQISLVLCCSIVFKLGGCAKFLGWAGLSERKKQRYLLILQSAGSAPAAITFAMAVGIPTFLILIKNHEEKRTQKPFNQSDVVQEPLFLVMVISACLSGSLAGAGWTNINMSNALRVKHAAPEAHASSSLIQTYAEPEDDDEPEENAELGAAPKPKRRVWFLESFGLPMLMTICGCVLLWIGFFPGSFEFAVWKISSYAKLTTEWNEDIGGHTDTPGYFINDKASNKASTKNLNVGIALAAISALVGKQTVKISVKSQFTYGGIGALLSIRTCITMLLGSLVAMLGNAFFASKIAGIYDVDAVHGSELFKSNQYAMVGKNLKHQMMMWTPTNGAGYKWVGVTCILVNTMYIMYKMMTGGVGGGSGGLAKKATLAKKGWTYFFNIICFVASYALFLVFLSQFSANVPFKLRCIYAVVVFFLDYLLNMIGGLQSLTVGGSCSPVSACLMVFGVIIGLFRNMELEPDHPDYDQNGIVGDYKIYALMFMRALLSISYTNDAAQDYATTQFLNENIYVATRQNLISALFGSFVIPAAFYVFSLGGKEYGGTEGYVCPQAKALSTILVGLKEEGGIPVNTVGISAVLGIVATFIEVKARSPAGHNDSKMMQGVRFVITGFTCTGFALGIYLGTATPIGTTLAAIALALGSMHYKAAGRERNKELYLVAVSFIMGPAIADLLKVGWLLSPWTNKGNTLWAPKPVEEAADKGAFTSGFKSSPETLLLQGFVLIVLILAVIFFNSKYGHEMEQSGEDVDPSSDEAPMVDDVDGEKREFQLAQLENTHDMSRKDFKDGVKELKDADEEVQRQAAKYEASQKTRARAFGKLMVDMLDGGFVKRNSTSVEHHRKFVRLVTIGIIVVMIATGISSYIANKSEHEWKVSWQNKDAETKVVKSL